MNVAFYLVAGALGLFQASVIGFLMRQNRNQQAEISRLRVTVGVVTKHCPWLVKQ